MNLIEELQKDLKAEYEITKKFLDNYPEDKNDWKPHEKSMPLNMLTIHVVEIFGWPDFMMKTDYLDFAETPYSQPEIKTRKALQQKLEEDYAKGAEALKNLKPEDLDGRWQLKSGDYLIADWNKYEAIMQAFKQITHHRAQLGVYYRLNGVFVPGSYGPSADEMGK